MENSLANAQREYPKSREASSISMAEAGPADDDFEDFDDDSNFWDDCDEYYEPETLNDERQREQQLTQEDWEQHCKEQLTQEEWEQQLPQHHRRRERVAELVETERNYIKDLETLLEVSALASSRNHVLKAIDLHTVLGNISQVLDMNKRLLNKLEQEQQHSDEDMLIGWVFLQFKSELCQVYKVYCSTYSVEVLPLLKKYEESEVAEVELAWIAGELKSHSKHLLSLNTVLIKPVQRILKYHLYLKELVHDTVTTHQDYLDLQMALYCLQADAKELNEYTRGLGLVHKYRSDVDDSLHGKIRRVNLHSIAKKSARMSTILSQKLGIIGQTTNTNFDKMVTKFRSVQWAAGALVTHTESLLEAVRTRHTAELIISESLADLLPPALHIQVIREVTLDSCNRILQMFDCEVQQRVLQPAAQVVMLCKAPSRLIQKRHNKKLDYDAAQAKEQLDRDINTAASEDEDMEVKGAYMSLNSLLTAELPVLTQHAAEMLTLAIRSLAASRLYLQGHLAKVYLKLAQVPLLEYIDPMEAQERAQQQVEQLRRLLPHDYQKKYMAKEHILTKTTDTLTLKTEKVTKLTKPKLSPHMSRANTPLQLSLSSPGQYCSNTIATLPKGRRSDPTGTKGTLKVSKEPRRGSLPGGYIKSVADALRGSPHTPAHTSPTHAPQIKIERDLLGSYPEENLYMVTEEYTAAKKDEVSLLQGAVVAVLKKMDPMGDPTCWVVDNGETVGLVKALCLRQLTSEREFTALEPAGLLPNTSSINTNSSGFHQPQLQAKHCQPHPTFHSPALSHQLAPQMEVLNPHPTPESQILTFLPTSQSQTMDSHHPSHLPLKHSRYPVSEHNLNTLQSETHEAIGLHTFYDSEEQCSNYNAESIGQEYEALYDFEGGDETQLSLSQGQRVRAINDDFPDWWYVSDSTGHVGYVPATYLHNPTDTSRKSASVQKTAITHQTSTHNLCDQTTSTRF
ncbi:dynamin-binding protein-like [Homarus americanus]|uniref:dynamin-binding protein-like n=1 Tax=Homarus americanus TaxID=6706 RepID=UPI001C45CD18|nr:dynamin-binding protein-like [Homarus americanus]